MPLPAPRADIAANTFDNEVIPLVKPQGFREYDARWLLGERDQLPRPRARSAWALATYFHEAG